MQKLTIGVVAALAVLIAAGFALPRHHTVTVATEIDAHPATVYTQIAELRRHRLWSPWAAKEPDLRIEYDGPPKGPGATMRWSGAVVGSGSQTIIDSRKYELVELAINPGDDSEALAGFTLAPGIGTTKVQWAFRTDYGFNIAGRYFASVLGRMVAEEHRVGLQQLRELAESLPADDFSQLDVERRTVEPATIAYLSVTSPPDTASVSAAMRQGYFEILRFIDDNGLTDAGPPLAVLRHFSGAERTFEPAIPVEEPAEPVARSVAGVRLGTTYAGEVLRVAHRGAYDGLGDTHRRIAAYLAAHGIERNGAPWETYVTDPGNVSEAELLTYLYYPILRSAD